MSSEIFIIPETDETFDEQIEQLQRTCFRTGLSTDDTYWKNLILKYLFLFYNQHYEQRETFASKKEDEIKKCISDWLNDNMEFCGSLSVELEPRTEGEQLGFYDMKFQSRLWRRGKKYFAFECKQLDESKTKTNEYVYRKENKHKAADGGLYRFLIAKYAPTQDFGGMIGFVQKGTIQRIIRNIKSSIRQLELKNDENESFGKLIEPDLLEQTINNNRNTFYSNHSRWDKTNLKMLPPIQIYHIFFDFTKP